jgi:hypothetical protein
LAAALLIPRRQDGVHCTLLFTSRKTTAIALVVAVALFLPNVINADRGSKAEVSQRAKVVVPAACG